MSPTGNLQLHRPVGRNISHEFYTGTYRHQCLESKKLKKVPKFYGTGKNIS